jgi:hypothetical protein
MSLRAQRGNLIMQVQHLSYEIASSLAMTSL